MPKEGHPPYIPLYVNDLISDGVVELMDTLEFGTYHRLLYKAWFEKPVGSIPADDSVLAAWARLSPDQWAGCKTRVLAAFSLGKDNRFHQKRLAHEYRKMIQNRKNKSEAGKKGMKNRWRKSAEIKEVDNSVITENNSVMDVLITEHNLSSSSSLSISKNNSISLLSSEDKSGDAPPAPEGKGPAPIETDVAATQWIQEMWQFHKRRGWPSCADWTLAHHQAALKLAETYGSIETLRDRLETAILERIPASDYLMGKTKEKFRVSMSWLLGMVGSGPAGLVRVMDGAYGGEEEEGEGAEGEEEDGAGGVVMRVPDW